MGDDRGISLAKGMEIILDESPHHLHKSSLLSFQLSQDHPGEEDNYDNKQGSTLEIFTTSNF